MNSHVIRFFSGRPKDRFYLLVSLFLIVLVTSCNNEEIENNGDSYKKHIVFAEKYVNIDLDSAVIFASKAVESTKNQNESFGKFHAQLVLNEVLWLQSGAKEINLKELERCKVWFEKHQNYKELVRTEILTLNIRSQSKGREDAWERADNLINRAKLSNDDLTMGRAYFFKMSSRDYTRNWDEDVHLLDSARACAMRANNHELVGAVRLASILPVNGWSRSFDSLFLTLKEAKEKHLPLLECASYKSLSLAYSVNPRIRDSAHIFIDKGIKLARQVHSPFSEMMMRSGKVEVFNRAEEHDSLIYLGTINLAQAREMKSNYLEIRLLNLLAMAWYQKGENSKGIEFARASLQLAETLKDDAKVISTKKILIRFLSKAERNDEAEKVALEIIDWSLQRESTYANQTLLASSYYVLGTICNAKEDYLRAKVNFQKASNVLKKRSGSNRFIADVSALTALIMLDSVPEAEELHDTIVNRYSTEIRKHPNFSYAKGQLMIVLQKHEEAINAFEWYLEKYPNPSQFNLYVSHKNLGEAYSALGNFKKAAESNRKALDTRDKIDETKDDLKLEKIQSKFELSQKETKIEKLENDKLRQKSISEAQKTKLQARRLWIIFLVVLLLFSVAIVFFIYRSYKDVQLRKEVEKSAREKEQKMERLKAEESKRLMQMKNQLFANISHEFRTPLTLILAPVEEMMEKLPKKEQKQLKTVQRNTEDLLIMVEEMLELARMDSGTINLSKKNFLLNDFMNEINAGFTALFKQSSVDFNMQLPETNVCIHADANRLKMVMNNLLKNAFHYTPESGRVAVNVNTNLEEGTLIITVFNSGESIDQNFLPHLFDRYTRSEQSEYIGYGIGLSLCKEIVTMHNGNMEVSNFDGEGVQFSFSIPTLFQLAPERVSNVTILDTESSREQSSKRPSVLVVEDKREMRSLLEEILKDDFTLTFAIDGEEGIKKAQNEQPDLIVSDVMMPKLDGIELTELIRQEFETSHIPIILLTAKSEQEDRLQGLETGADDYLTKPFSPKELRVRIKNLIKQREQLRERFAKEIFVQPDDLVCTSLDKEFLTNAIHLVEANMTDPGFNVEILCQELALNRNSVHVKLKSLTGYSTTQFMRSVKLKKAATLLKDDRYSISEVADLAGFNNRQAFNKAFKELFDMTPTVYREKVKKNENLHE